MFVGIGLMGGGFMMLATVQSLVWFYVVFVATIALGASFSFTQPVQAVVINWFIRRRTRVLGIVLTGSAIGGLIVPAVAWGIETHGWRGTAFFSGVSIITLGWPIAAVMRYRPEPYGYQPDNQPRPTKSQNDGPADDEGYFTPGEAIRSPTFWVMGLCFAMRMLGTAAVPVHLVAYLSEDVGFSTTRAALFLGLIGPASAGGRLGMGFLGDMFPKSQVVFLAFGIQAVGIATLGFVDGPAMAIVFLVLFSTGHGGAAPLMFATRADYFGRRHYATVSGMMAPVMLVGTVTGPVVAAVFADNLSDGYSIVFIMYGALLGAASVVLLFLKPPRFKQRAVESGEPARSGSV
jgi:MFS family permease